MNRQIRQSAPWLATMAEHRAYLPLACLVALAVGGARRLPGRKWPAALGAALALGALTFHRNADYRSSESIWTDTVRQRPANARAHHSLGLLTVQSGRLDEAGRHFAAAVALNPTLKAQAHYNLGLGYFQAGQPALAITQYELALAADPALAEAEHNLGYTLATVQRLDDAERHYRAALRLRPDYPDALNNLANLLLVQDRVAEAIGYYELCLRLDPSHAGAARNLALARTLPAAPAPP